MSDNRFTIYGIRPSYFTQKVLGLFAFKGISYDFRMKTLAVRRTVEARSGTRLIPVVVTPEGEWKWDSTPIAFDLDERFPDSPVIPPAGAHPVSYVAMRILEDYFDEWLTRQALFYRWNHDADRKQLGDIIARDIAGVRPGGRAGPIQWVKAQAVKRQIRKWAGRAVLRAGAGENQREELTDRFENLMRLLHQHFSMHSYLLGPRPTLADWALFGALEAHFLHDPTPRDLIQAIAPAVATYHRRLNSVRAEAAPEWPDNDLPASLTPVLELVATSFHDFLTANRASVRSGLKFVDIDLGYGQIRLRARPYTETTRKQTAAALAAMPESDRSTVREALEPLGCLSAYLA